VSTVSGFVFSGGEASMSKKVPLQERNTQPVITMLPLPLRKQVEKLARQGKVSLSEIGRRALTAYVEQKEG
jgi:hypothetical protein